MGSLRMIRVAWKPSSFEEFFEVVTVAPEFSFSLCTFSDIDQNSVHARLVIGALRSAGRPVCPEWRSVMSYHVLPAAGRTPAPDSSRKVVCRASRRGQHRS
ncbi:hypothetical protein ACCAA_350103 [Candidatus Accumulibacter aalborgensis]|uniref:Uncharacterized protein n=1 Tax=Candidatus Accumulibacter aalborgensis TaxID=1860102 RepID=A0A1A8XQJ6_9PROT|nr:hypothetical protein ACCAA_350103 [Candidatus Accumulibacter aalborgensis]